MGGGDGMNWGNQTSEFILRLVYIHIYHASSTNLSS
jgi:hypothetical protein